MFEIISFILLMLVLLFSGIVLLATGKFRAFVFRKRKEKPDGEVAEVVMEVGTWGWEHENMRMQMTRIGRIPRIRDWDKKSGNSCPIRVVLGKINNQLMKGKLLATGSGLRLPTERQSLYRTLDFNVGAIEVCKFAASQLRRRVSNKSDKQIYTDCTFIIVQLRLRLIGLYSCSIGINHCNLYFVSGLKYKYNWYNNHSWVCHNNNAMDVSFNLSLPKLTLVRR